MAPALNCSRKVAPEAKHNLLLRFLTEQFFVPSRRIQLYKSYGAFLFAFHVALRGDRDAFTLAIRARKTMNVAFRGFLWTLPPTTATPSSGHKQPKGG